MEAKYQLITGVYLVTGVSRGAILDTNTGLVYSINKQACLVATYQLEDDPFWLTLKSMGIAEEAQSPSRKQLLPRLEDDCRLKFIWFEIVTNDCNQRCIHCYADAMPKSYRKNKPSSEFQSEAESNHNIFLHKQRMMYVDWLRVIQKANELGCKACQFIGGEPLLYKGENGETVFDLVAYTREIGYSSIEIFTNATLLTPTNIQLIKELGVKVAVSLYSDDPAVHDSITRTPGSYAKTINSLTLMKENRVETRVETIVMKANQESITSTLAFRKEMGLKGRRPDPLRPGGRGNNPINQPDNISLIRYGFRFNPNFIVNKEMISHNMSRHPCLHGKIAITEFGDAIPCIFLRDHILMNYLDTHSLQPILKSPELRQIWHSTKDRVYICQDCEYRYLCFDCRALAESAANGYASFEAAPYPRCTYNPYSGQWGGGVWKVGRKGKPYYDQSLSADINGVRQSIEI
jgi:radical SAM protein with 4Fe4S-binding SPASM domain